MELDFESFKWHSLYFPVVEPFYWEKTFLFDDMFVDHVRDK